MYKLDTVQKQQNLNDVCTYDQPGAGGANHAYAVYEREDIIPIAIIQFQSGARTSSDSITGVVDSDLLEMIRHRLMAFQEGPFYCTHNKIALYHIEQALEALNQRVEDRIARDVLSKEEK